MRVAAVGGIDPTGGSGIGRDAATLAAVGVTPITIATAATVQGALGVARIEPIDPTLVAEQLVAAVKAGARAIKLGMLHRAAIVEAIEPVLSGARIPVVFDPVLAASAGGALAEPDLLGRLDLLQPVVTLVTPNLLEARLLLGDPRIEAAAAADALLGGGWRGVLVTGGDQDATDHLAVGADRHRLHGIRHPELVRGTGCALASLIAASLAARLELEEACRVAKGQLGRAIRASRNGLLSLRDEPAWALAGHPFE